MEGGLRLSRLFQIGVVVRDIDEAVDYYSSTFGLGPFRTMVVERHGAIVRGKPADYKVKLAFAQMGDIEFELVQILEGETIQSEFLRKKGEGLHHIAFIVDDLEAEIAKWGKKGIRVLQRSKPPATPVEGGYAYMDTEKTGGVIFELVQRRRG